MDRADVVVIGAGLVGAALAYDLATRGVRVVVLEAGRELAAGASRSNSGIVHTGFDSPPGTLETAMIRRQAGRWRAIFDALAVPYRVPGALLVAVDDGQAAQLPAIAAKAATNGVAVEPLTEAEVRRREPHAVGVAGLLVPDEAITDPFELVRRLLATGPDVRLNTPVQRVVPDGAGVRVETPNGTILAPFAVNCAGLYADEVAADNTFRITPRRGEFLVFGTETGRLLNHMLLPVPSEQTKGVLVFPTLYGHLCAGPSAVDQEDKEDWRPREGELEQVYLKATQMLPALCDARPVDSWAGLRPVGHPHNYIVAWSSRVPSMLHLAGIRSTGLSACLGLSQYALALLAERGLPLGPHHPPAAPTFADPPRPWWQRLNQLRWLMPDA